MVFYKEHGLIYNWKGVKAILLDVDANVNRTRVQISKLYIIEWHALNI